MVKLWKDVELCNDILAGTHRCTAEHINTKPPPPLKNAGSLGP